MRANRSHSSAYFLYSSGVCIVAPLLPLSDVQGQRNAESDVPIYHYGFLPTRELIGSPEVNDLSFGWGSNRMSRVAEPTIRC
jgi:hypothetical protein